VLPNGQWRDFAGTGTAGYKGDGGPAARAELSEPAGVAVDAKGNVYIADSSNDVVRRVDARTGVITTVAGNFAADQVSTPAADGTRTVFLQGQGGFAGDGGPATAARLNAPQGVALDPAGDLFIADTLNNAIREVTPDGNIFTVVNAAGAGGAAPTSGAEVAGPATASKLSGPSAVAVDSSTGTLYIADITNEKVAAVTGLAQTSPAAAGPIAPAASH
jgi:streptogramin lyase